MFGSGNLIPLATVAEVAERAQVRETVPFALLDMSRPVSYTHLTLPTTSMV